MPRLLRSPFVLPEARATPRALLQRAARLGNVSGIQLALTQIANFDVLMDYTLLRANSMIGSYLMVRHTRNATTMSAALRTVILGNVSGMATEHAWLAASRCDIATLHQFAVMCALAAADDDLGMLFFFAREQKSAGNWPMEIDRVKRIIAMAESYYGTVRVARISIGDQGMRMLRQWKRHAIEPVLPRF